MVKEKKMGVCIVKGLLLLLGLKQRSEKLAIL